MSLLLLLIQAAVAADIEVFTSDPMVIVPSYTSDRMEIVPSYTSDAMFIGQEA